MEFQYHVTKKQDDALLISLKHFRVYFGYSKVVAFISHPVVKEILKEEDSLGTKGKWITKIQEYNLEIQPTKPVKGHRLAQLMVEGNEGALDLKGASVQAVLVYL